MFTPEQYCKVLEQNLVFSPVPLSPNCLQIKEAEALEYKEFVFWRGLKKYLSIDSIFRYKLNSLPKEKR